MPKVFDRPDTCPAVVCCTPIDGSEADWDDLRGIARTDVTGDMSSEAFIRKIRDEWEEA